MGGIKANIGHAEPAAGMTGLLRLALALGRAAAAPNAQLRVVNPHVGDALRGVACALPTQLATLSVGAEAGGVSSFGYSGTIAHAVLLGSGRAAEMHSPPTPPLPSPPTRCPCRRGL